MSHTSRGYVPRPDPLTPDQVMDIFSRVKPFDAYPADDMTDNNYDGQWASLTGAIPEGGYDWDSIEAAIKAILEAPPELRAEATKEACRLMFGARRYTELIEHDFTESIKVLGAEHNRCVAFMKLHKLPTNQADAKDDEWQP